MNATVTVVSFSFPSRQEGCVFFHYELFNYCKRKAYVWSFVPTQLCSELPK